MRPCFALTWGLLACAAREPEAAPGMPESSPPAAQPDPSTQPAEASKLEPELAAALDEGDAATRLRVQVELVEGTDADALLAELPAGEVLELRRMQSMPLLILEVSAEGARALDRAPAVRSVSLDGPGGGG